MNWPLLIVAGIGAAVLTFTALLWAALVAGSRADDRLESAPWKEPEDGYPPDMV